MHNNNNKHQYMYHARRAGAPTLIYELLFKTPRDIRENETPYLDPFFDGESEFVT